jgi:hypothetical protein
MKTIVGLLAVTVACLGCSNSQQEQILAEERLQTELAELARLEREIAPTQLDQSKLLETLDEINKSAAENAGAEGDGLDAALENLKAVEQVGDTATKELADLVNAKGQVDQSKLDAIARQRERVEEAKRARDALND